MESPLSRTPSHVFSPGPHRRSHPNLHHLSLAPLTPKYPIDPADYNPYFDPSTSQLHTSSSLSNIATLPSPGGILSSPFNHSRANSRTRLKRKVKSQVTIQGPNLPRGALTSQGFGAKTVRKTGLRVETDSTWLVQTGLALTEGSRESKGQMWLAKRDSSTSLQSPETDRQTRSRIATPNRSRRPSRSRRQLAMTPANDLKLLTTETSYEPDWADPQTQAEIAAETERELADELNMGDAEDEDQYGALDFEGHFEQLELDFDSQDEKDVQEAVRQGFGVGKWMDGWVDALLKIETEPDIEAQPKTESSVAFKPEASLASSDDSIEAPPVSQNIWHDLRWLGGLVAKSIGS